MAVTSSKTVFYSSGSISFSSLRSNFKEQVSGEIKASELRRNDSLTDTNPIVPTAKENLAISTSSNLKLSQFKNSIKYYNLTQTETDLNLDIGNPKNTNTQYDNWNGNLNYNIKKIAYLNGICGSNNNTLPSVKLSNNACNLLINVSGQIYAAGGSGGTSSSVSGENGGNALLINPTVGNNISVRINELAQIYGGGGGGERGKKGSNGDDGKCINYSYYERKKCRSCPDCDGKDKRLYCYDRQGRCSTIYQYREIKCRKSNVTSVNGGIGGAGGNGGHGRGYNYPDPILNLLDGSEGSDGTNPRCTGYDANGNPIPAAGKKGQTGGSGGNWGKGGVSTNNTETSSGGSAGKAITGANYIIDERSIINSTTIKGAYKPTS